MLGSASAAASTNSVTRRASPGFRAKRADTTAPASPPTRPAAAADMSSTANPPPSQNDEPAPARNQKPTISEPSARPPQQSANRPQGPPSGSSVLEGERTSRDQRGQDHLARPQQKQPGITFVHLKPSFVVMETASPAALSGRGTARGTSVDSVWRRCGCGPTVSGHRGDGLFPGTAPQAA